MANFDDIQKLFSMNLNHEMCLEIEFCVADLPNYQGCWMGKAPNKSSETKESYWFGLTEDGSKAYDYDNFDDFSNAPVFDGRSLKDIWNKVELCSVDGCAPDERIQALILNFHF